MELLATGELLPAATTSLVHPPVRGIDDLEFGEHKCRSTWEGDHMTDIKDFFDRKIEKQTAEKEFCEKRRKETLPVWLDDVERLFDLVQEWVQTSVAAGHMEVKFVELEPWKVRERTLRPEKLVLVPKKGRAVVLDPWEGGRITVYSTSAGESGDYPEPRFDKQEHCAFLRQSPRAKNWLLQVGVPVTLRRFLPTPKEKRLTKGGFLSFLKGVWK